MTFTWDSLGQWVTWHAATFPILFRNLTISLVNDTWHAIIFPILFNMHYRYGCSITLWMLLVLKLYHTYWDFCSLCFDFCSYLSVMHFYCTEKRVGTTTSNQPWNLSRPLSITYQKQNNYLNLHPEELLAIG